MRLSAVSGVEAPPPASIRRLLPSVSFLVAAAARVRRKIGKGRHSIGKSRADHVPGSPLEAAAAAAARGGGGAGCGDGGDAAVHGAFVPQAQLLGPDQQAPSHEGVVQHGREAGPLAGVFLQELVDQVLGLQRHVRGHGILPEDHFGQGVLDCVRVKRRAAHQEGVEHAPEGPDVRLEAVRAAGGHLGGDVVGRAAHGEVLLVGELQLSGQAEVCYFNVHVVGQQKVGQGQVPVQDPVRVEVQHSFHDLMHEMSRCGTQTSIRFHLAEVCQSNYGDITEQMPIKGWF